MRYLKFKQKFIGTLILVMSYAYIVYRLSYINISLYSLNFDSSEIIYSLIFIILTILNIITESIKWKLLLSDFIQIKLLNSVKMVFAGFSSGIFTPAKIGEPYGRIISLPKKLWSKGTALNYFGGFLQNIVIFIIGIVFTYYSISTKNFQHSLLLKQAITILAISLLAFYILYIFRYRLYTYISRYKILNSITKSFIELLKIKLINYIKLFLLSTLRYFIYCTQLFLLLYIFSESQFSISTILLIPIYFMCITIIPSFLLADLGIRNSVALFLFSNQLTNETTIVLAVSTLWIINQVIPAIIGSFFMLKKSR